MDETYSTEGPICPYCDHKHRADDPFYYDERNDEMECERCEKSFVMRVSHSTSWSCEAIDPA